MSSDKSLRRTQCWQRPRALSPSVRSASPSMFHEGVVGIAVQPAFARFGRRDGQTASSRARACWDAGWANCRSNASPALLAGAQVYPLRAYLHAVIPATITDIGELPATPTRMSFSAVCSGVNVSCSIMNGVLGPGALWALLPPIFDLNAGSSASLRRTAQSILGKSLTITFNGDAPALIWENS